MVEITSLAAAAEEHEPACDEVKRVRRAGPRRGAPDGDAARGQGAEPGDLGVDPSPRRLQAAAVAVVPALGERGGGAGAPVAAAQRLPERVRGGPGPERAAGGGEGEHGLGREQTEDGEDLVVAQLRDGRRRRRRRRRRPRLVLLHALTAAASRPVASHRRPWLLPFMRPLPHTAPCLMPSRLIPLCRHGCVCVCFLGGWIL